MCSCFMCALYELSYVIPCSYTVPLLYIFIPSHIFFKYIFDCHVFLWYFTIRNILHCHVHKHSVFSKENRLYRYKQLCVPFPCMYNIRMYFHIYKKLCRISDLQVYHLMEWSNRIWNLYVRGVFAPQNLNRSHIVNSVHVWAKAENSVLYIVKTKIYSIHWLDVVYISREKNVLYIIVRETDGKMRKYTRKSQDTHISGPRRVNARKLYLYIKIHHITRNTIRSRRVKNMPAHTNRVYYMLYAEWVYTRYTFSMTPPIN